MAGRRSSRDFEGRPGAALVAGGSGAIGSAVARLLAERGSRVAISYRGNTAAAAAVVRDIEASGGEAASWRVDLTDVAATAAFIAEVQSRFDGLHTLVYAAGPELRLLHLSRITPERYREHIEADSMAFYNLIFPALPSLRENRGCVVAVSTMATGRVVIRDLLSSGPKAAIEAVVKQLAVEEGRFGVRANSVGVGMTGEGMAVSMMEAGDLSDEVLKVVTSTIPLRRWGTALDMAEAVCFLASNRASFITGQRLDVDGGMGL